MIKLLGVVKWIIRESKESKSKFPTIRVMVNDLIMPKDACLYLDSIYYNNTLNLTNYVCTLGQHLSHNIWSYYTLHLLMDACDISSFMENTMHYIHHQDLFFLMLNVYKLFLNITIQHVRL